MRRPLRILSLSAVLAGGIAGILALTLSTRESESGAALHAHQTDPVPSILTIEENGLRYTYHVISGSEALFDMRGDPGSLRNLLPARAADAARMRRRLERRLGVDSLEELRESRRRRIEELKALGYL